MTPTLLQTQYGFAPADTLAANGVAIVCLSLGCVLAGLAADRFGPGLTFLVGGALLLASSWLFYTTVKARPELLLPLYALAGLCVGMIGAIPMVMVKAFPAVVRFSGLSFSYNLAYAIFGGLTPILVSLLLKWSPLGPAYYVGALCLLFMLIGALLWQRQVRQLAPA
jgi:MFS family permease